MRSRLFRGLAALLLLPPAVLVASPEAHGLLDRLGQFKITAVTPGEFAAQSPPSFVKIEGQFLPDFPNDPATSVTIPGVDANILSIDNDEILLWQIDASGAPRGLHDVTVSQTVNGHTESATCTDCLRIGLTPVIDTATAQLDNEPIADQTVTVTGSNFESDVEVELRRMAGSTVLETVQATGESVAGGTLTATVAASDLTHQEPGPAWDLFVINNSGPEEATAQHTAFQIAAQAPTTPTASPAVLGQNAGEREVTLTGDNYFQGVNVTSNVTGVSVKAGSVNRVDVNTVAVTLVIAENATVGEHQSALTVSNTDGANANTRFTVNSRPKFSLDGGPVVSFPEGARGQSFVLVAENNSLDGSETVEMPSVAVNGSVTRSWNPATQQLTVGFDVREDLDVLGQFTFDVVDPVDFGRTTCVYEEINQEWCVSATAGPEVETVENATAPVGGAVQVTVKGKNFQGADPRLGSLGVANPKVEIGNLVVTDVRWQGPTQLGAKVTVPNGAAVGTHDVVVENLDGGRDTLAGAFTVT